MKNLNYRIFPVLFLAFFRVANAVVIGLVIPLYYFEKGYSPDLIGILSASMTFTYIFSPLLLNKFARRIKKKYALLISSFLILIIQITFQFNLNPWFFLVMRLLEGILLGLFWPILGGTISSLNSYNVVEENPDLEKSIMKRYTLSWNLGGIFGFLVGAVILFIIANLELIFDVSLVYMVIMVIMVILYEEPRNNESSINKKFKDGENTSSASSSLDMISILFSFFILFLYSFIGSSFKFLYPLKSEILEFQEYTNYVLSFILSVSQLFFTNSGMGLSFKILKRSILPSLGVTILLFIFAGLSKNLIMFGILFGFMGLSLAFLYCYSFKSMIARNVEESTSKYSFYFESVIGLGFFSGPIISGIFANIGINNAFFIFAGIVILTLFVTFIYKYKIKNEKTFD